MTSLSANYAAKRGFFGAKYSPGFSSLAEVLATLVIGALLLMALVSIHSRAEDAAGAVNQKLDSSRLPAEILQLIAEDLDRQIAPGSNTTITFANKYIKGYQAAQLKIVRSVTDSSNKQRILEEIVWQSSYDFESDLEGLILYRSHGGITLEDNLLDRARADFDKIYPYVPLCAGVTFFEILSPSGKTFVNKWSGATPPKGLVMSISFARPEQSSDGSYEILDEDKVTRTIAIDRTRTIPFQIVSREEEEKGRGNARTTSR